MNGKSQGSAKPFVDPDEAPEITDEFFQHGQWRIDDIPVSPTEGARQMQREIARGRPKLPSPKVSVTMRYDAVVIESFRATGKGWQTRMNDALREWLAAHPR